MALAAAEADVNTANAQIRVARSLRTPDVTVSVAARRLEATNDTAAVVGVNVERVADIPVGGPMVAVGRRPDPRLWSALSYAPLRELAAAYAAASAEILEHTGNRYSYTHVGQAKGAVQ